MSTPTSAPRNPAGWYPLLFAASSVGVANSVVFSLLSNLQDRYGFGDAGLGLIAGSGFLVGLVGQVLLAPFADRGHAKRLMLAGLATAVLGSIVFASANSLLMLVVARAIVGLSNSLFSPAARAIVISIDERQIARRLGTFSGMELAGFVTGPVVGGLLVGPLGVRLPFLVAGSCALLGLLLLSRRALPMPPEDDQQRLAFDLLRIPRIRAGVLMAVALFLPVGVYDATFDRYLTDMGGSDAVIGLAFLAYGLPFAILATTGGRLAERFGPLRASFVGTLAVVPLTVTYGFVGVPELIVGLSVVEGSIHALAIPASQAVVASGAPEGRAAAAQGLSGAATLAVAASLAFAAGGVYGWLGPEWMFSIVGALVTACAVAAVLASRSRLSSSAR